MNYDHYDALRFTDDYHIFMFYSEGPKGKLIKLVGYTMLENLPDTFNLGLATLKKDKNDEEYLDSEEVSDNGDRDKILATIAITAYSFIAKYPNKKIYLKGSDKARTRLYQMAINHAYEELSKRLVIYGDTGGEDNYEFQRFVKGVNYTGFLIEKK